MFSDILDVSDLMHSPVLRSTTPQGRRAAQHPGHER
jgi:hypothetical protein